MTGTQRLAGVVGRFPQTRSALEYAARQHAGQRRSTDGAPFLEHPVEVGWLLYGVGAPDRVIAGGILHDVLEKTDVTASDLERQFGPAIAKLVSAVSEDTAIADYEPRKAALRHQAAAGGPEALTIFAADKVSKIRELRRAAVHAARRGQRLDDSVVPPRRLAHFDRCLGMLEDLLPDASLVAQLRTELVGLNHELAAGTEAAAA